MTNMDQEQRDTVGHAAPTTVEHAPTLNHHPTGKGSSAAVINDENVPPKSGVIKETKTSTPVLPTTTANTTITTPNPKTTTTTTHTNSPNLSTTVPTTPKKNAKIKLHEVNSYLTCRLCKGYLIDATTISECLHSFCRSCIITFLQDNSHCPECEVVINKTKPNLKLDKTLQDIVYKLVPELYLNEMTRRRQFYASRPAGLKAQLSPEQRGDDTERIVFNARDKFSLCLEYISDDSTPGAILLPHNANESLDVATIINNNTIDTNNKPPSKEGENNMRRYLQCPGMCRIDVLKKFVRNKYNVDTNNYHIDILYKRVPLPDHYTLIDIAYIYSWKRNEPMKFFFRITDIQQVRDRFDFYEDAQQLQEEEEEEAKTKQDESSIQAPVKNVHQVHHTNEDKCAVKTSDACVKVKKSKSVRFHNNVLQSSPVATSTPIKHKSEKSDNNNHKGDKHDKTEKRDKSDKQERIEKVEKLTNGVVLYRPQSPAVKPNDAIDVNCDEWLKKQVKRAAKELKKSKGKEVKNAIKDMKETIKDLQATIKDISENGVNKVNGLSCQKLNGVSKLNKLNSDKKVKLALAAGIKVKKVSVKTSPSHGSGGASVPKVDLNGVKKDNANLDLGAEKDFKVNAATEMARVDKEQFLRLMQLQATNSISAQVTGKKSEPPISNQRKSSPIPTSSLSPSRKSPKSEKAESPKKLEQGQKRKLVSPVTLSGGNKEVKKTKLSLKKSPKVSAKVPNAKSTKKESKEKVNVSHPVVPSTMSMSLTPVPNVPPLKPAQNHPKTSKIEQPVNLEEPSLKSLLHTCKIPSSLSITCVNGGATDRESQIKPVINHIEILKLPEVREVASPDSSTSSKLDKVESRNSPIADDSKAFSKEKLEKVGTTMKLQSKEEAKPKVKENAESELSITITMEKDVDRKDNVKENKDAQVSPESTAQPGIGIHPNLPKIVQPTPTGRNLNSFQKMFEDTVRKRNELAGLKEKAKHQLVAKPEETTGSNGVNVNNVNGSKTSEEKNNKRNILEIASQLYSKKTKLEKDHQEAMITNAQGKVAIPRLKKPCDTLSNLHSNKLALNYSVSINQTPPANENVVTSTTTTKLDSPKNVSRPSTPRPLPSPKSAKAKPNTPRAKPTSPLPIAPKGNNKPSLSPNFSIPPSLSPFSQPILPTPLGITKLPSPSPANNSNSSHSPSLRDATKPNNPQKLDVNQLQEKYNLQSLANLQEKYNLQNLAQLSASFNFPGAIAHPPPHQAMAAIQQAMLLNFGMQNRPWFNMPPANMVQYEKFLQSLGGGAGAKSPGGQNHLLSKEN